ncbi:transcriptional regulator, LysR family [Sphingobium chlorophenolicum L-1]|uniref:Transcriptional regulator, LysR family n=1 Tax=Sphingobium chlorophenolicum L-1 TaxID=690566 RepID=F6F333_SPHCR|nr:LysR family transcriptional regulator [Sphingobium chlorophenolicum]AEG50845.1 transcriptional regulator, LysR family [Sphingobium chlorophenolicum L-1]
MDLHTRHLRYFLTIAETGSFTRAADKLGVSQPALSQRIQSLEKQLGFKLFLRSGRNVVVSSAGAALIEPVRGLVAYSQRIERLVRDRSARQPRTLRIGVAIHSDFSERTALLADFFEAYPNQQVSQETGYTIGLYQSLLDCELDAAILVGPAPDESFDWIALRWFEAAVILPRDDELAGETSLKPDMLTGRSIVAFPRKRHPELYDKLIQPLADIGAVVVNSPDQTPLGMLAYAQMHGACVPVAFPQLSDEELDRHHMVSRPLSGLNATAALLVVRARGDNGVNDGFWRFAAQRGSPLPQ